MIAAKLQSAKDTVEVWASTGHGQAGFEWQFEMLTKMRDEDAATELSVWWYTHPSNPNRLDGIKHQ